MTTVVVELHRQVEVARTSERFDVVAWRSFPSRSSPLAISTISCAVGVRRDVAVASRRLSSGSGWTLPRVRVSSPLSLSKRSTFSAGHDLVVVHVLRPHADAAAHSAQRHRDQQEDPADRRHATVVCASCVLPGNNYSIFVARCASVIDQAACAPDRNSTRFASLCRPDSRRGNRNGPQARLSSAVARGCRRSPM